MKDLCGRTIRYLRVSLTDRCNLRCRYCMPKQGVEKKGHEEMLAVEEFYKVIAQAVELGIEKVRLTGGEPLLYRGLAQLLERLKGLGGLRDLALTTNGVLLQQWAKPLKEAGVKRINLSLDTLNPEKYKKITRGGDLQRVLDGLAQARAQGLFPIKMNVVLIGGWNDDELEALADLVTQGFVDELRFIELMTIGETSAWSQKRFVSGQLVVDRLGLVEEPVQAAGPAVMYRGPHGERIGLIRPISHKFCSSCDRLRLTADGKLKPCLLSDEEWDVKGVLRTGGDVGQLLEQVIRSKPAEHHLEQQGGVPGVRNMGAIGG